MHPINLKMIFFWLKKGKIWLEMHTLVGKRVKFIISNMKVDLGAYQRNDVFKKMNLMITVLSTYDYIYYIYIFLYIYIHINTGSTKYHIFPPCY